MLIKKEKIADDVAPVPTPARKPPPAGHTVPAVQLIEYLPLNAIVPYNAQVCHVMHPNANALTLPPTLTQNNFVATFSPAMNLH